MENKPLTEKQILRDLARIQLLDFNPSDEDSFGEEEIMQKEHDNVKLQWLVPTREARDLILAEEIIRFASTTDRPCTSNTHRITRITDPIPESTSDTEPFPCKRMANTTSGKRNNNTMDHLKSEVADREIDRTPTVTGATSRAMPIPSEAGASGSEPPQSASFRLSQPLASNFQDAHFPVEEAKIPIDPQPNTSSPQLPVYRANAIPVTNRILAAIAQNELEQSSSSDPVILKSTRSVETKDNSPPRNNGQLLDYFLEHLKTFQELDSSRSLSPVSPASLSPSDELSELNQHIILTTELEEMINKNMKVIVSGMLKHKFELQSLKKELNSKLALLKREQDQTDGAGGYKDYSQANQQDESIGVNDEISTNQEEGIPVGRVDNTCNQPVAENPNENGFEPLDGNDLNVHNVEAVHASDDDDAAQSEFPEAVNLSGPEWTRPEKRRLGIVIRDISREIKTKELQKKKARLLKKGRVIAQAIENKIFDINKQITAVNKKALRHVALPLDNIQDYDWVKVAAALNAKRSPEECRTYWKCFLHPAINGSEWNQVEVKEMEMIAQSHNFRNWEGIADELKTGRSGYQCYMFYRKHMCPHSELRDTCNKK